MSHESFVHYKMRGGCMWWVCVCGVRRCMFLHIMGVWLWAHGCFLGTEGLHCFAFQRRRRWAKGQQQILSSSDVSIADRISSPLQVTTIFFPSHSFVLTSLLSFSFPHTCACNNESCLLWKIYASRCLIWIWLPCWIVFGLLIDSGSSSSSEDEGSRRQNRGAGARNGEIRRRRSHSPASPRRRHRDASPRWKSTMFACTLHLDLTWVTLLRSLLKCFVHFRIKLEKNLFFRLKKTSLPG